jgi:outer membrane receptor protein involved in Fe transport
MRKSSFLLVLLTLLIAPTLILAQSGKISGQVRGGDTGEPLPGANVVVQGTSLGAATDLEGYFTILNVPPGVYTLQTSFIGYALTSISDVRVSINQTTTINFDLKAEAVAGEEVTVVSVRPVIEADVSANVANVQAAEIENVPVAGVSEFITLQSGIESNMSIRGSGFNEMAYLVDGITTRNARDGGAYTNVSYTGMEELQVQTGGFNAEYGNVRSGLINVVTKEGSREKYALDAFGRYTATENSKYFGDVPWLIETTEPTSDPNAFQWDAKIYDNFYTRPQFDPEVALNGADGVWDKYTNESYLGGEASPWAGWNALAASDPANADIADPADYVITGQDLQDMAAYELRKDNRIKDHDWIGDATISGPVPFVSSMLGDMRFSVSHRRTQTPYIIPGNFGGVPGSDPLDSHTDNLTQFKVTSDLKPGKMKLQVTGLVGSEDAINARYGTGNYNSGGKPVVLRGGVPSYPWEQNGTHYSWDARGRGVTPWFITNFYVPLDIQNNILGLDFTHTLSANTFYKVRISRSATKYETPVQEESLKIPDLVVGVVGNQEVDYAPFGQRGLNPPYGNSSRSGNGFDMSGIFGSTRDTSDVSALQINVDLTSQVNRWAQVKTGVEVISNSYDIYTGFHDQVFPHNGNPKGSINADPIQGAAYLQAKLEFQGMIANVGLRLDHYDPRIDWPSIGAFDQLLNNANSYKNLLANAPVEAAEKQTTLSPRLGISFPITHNSKLYFNFGHFRQFLDSDDLYALRGLDFGRVYGYGNPNQPFPTTVSYELGYDQNLSDTYLLRVAGFYKDRANQQQSVQFFGYNRNEVNYYQIYPLNYSDIRGFELSVNKNSGRWLRGFVNYTFLQTKSGRFGFGNYYENPREQRAYEATNTDHYLNTPVAQPFARANIELLIPTDYGSLLGDWRIDLLAEWRSGQHFTWSGSGAGTNAALNNNMQYKDFYDFDLRFSKNVSLPGVGRTQFFVDIQNVFNIKRLFRQYGAQGNEDWDRYMNSLQLPGDSFDDSDGNFVGSHETPPIPGDDRPGDYRDSDVAWVPIETAPDLATLPDIGFVESDRRVLGWTQDTETYYEYVNGAWQAADQSFVNQVLDDKAYINMPNFSTLNFLNPRSVQLGIRLSF